MIGSDESAQLQEKLLTGKLLIIGARRGSEAIDSFSGWLLSGFGGAFALLLANIGTAAKYVDLRALKRGAILFLVSVMCGVVQKLLAATVASSSAAGAEAELVTRGLIEAGIPIDFSVVLEQTEMAILFPSRWIARWSFNKVRAGDFAAAGRLCAILSQAQGWMVSIEAILNIAAAWFVMRGIIG